MKLASYSYSYPYPYRRILINPYKASFCNYLLLKVILALSISNVFVLGLTADVTSADVMSLTNKFYHNKHEVHRKETTETYTVFDNDDILNSKNKMDKGAYINGCDDPECYMTVPELIRSKGIYDT